MTLHEKTVKGPGTKLEVKIDVVPYAEDTPVVGPNVKVYARIRGEEVGEWFELPAKELQLSVYSGSLALADVTVRAQVVETSGLRALVDTITVEED